MKYNVIFFICFLITTSKFINAQESDPWVVGVGLNIVDNSGTGLKKILNIKDNWNFNRPLKLSIEKRFLYDYGIEVDYTMNKFAKGKKFNGEDNPSDVTYYSVDALFKNYTTNYFLDPRRSKIEGYTAAGLGVNLFDDTLIKSLNLGLGFNIKVGYSTKINLQAIGKFSIANNVPWNASHLQYSISFIKWL